ncbi:HDOD domain-containing protein [Breznakiellaceae bacterium SP9]
MVIAPDLVVDELKVKKAVQSGIPLTITTYTLPHEIEMYIEKVLFVFLKQLGQEKFMDYILYCVQELAVNAKKANTKRVYFIERGLDLNKSEDYKEGMEKFKENTLSNIGHYLQLQKEKGLYVRIIFCIKNNVIYVEVRNNVALTKMELIRIQDKLVRSRQYSNLQDALSQVIDDSEGAGLGLVILVLMLKKMGLGEDCFDILATEQETIARIIIPLDKTRLENLSILSKTIVDNVSSLPQFPENVLTVQKLLDNEKSEMGDVARHISTDPALMADLLKIVNSAQYMLSKKIDSIAEAVNMVGIRGIKNLLYSYGTQKVLGEESSESSEKKMLWEHSYKTAFYAYNLIKNFKKGRSLLDDVYVCGMLHDMGKIVFANVHPELLLKIKDFCTDKSLPPSTFEDLSAGMNHAEIGAMIAEKWNFPEGLVSAIRYHHDPLAAPQNYQDLVGAVYLANMFCEYENDTVSFDQFEPAILSNYSLNNKKQVDTLLERFQVGFKRENHTT